MIKKYCDICGKEAETIFKFSLPTSKVTYAKDKYGNKIIASGKVWKTENKDLCPECVAQLSNFVDNYLPLINDEENDKGVAICVYDKTKLTMGKYEMNKSIPCPVESVIRNNDNEKKYIIESYKIVGRSNLLFAECCEIDNIKYLTLADKTENIVIRINNGKLPSNFKILEVPDGEIGWKNA